MITVKNKLEVKLGGFIQVPGCEPVSSLSSLGLLVSYREQCKHSQIPVKIALKLIPGSKIVWVTQPTGYSATGMFLELPSGPPPDGEDCPRDCMPDWYAMLKRWKPHPHPVNEKCAGFDYDVCSADIDPFKVPCHDKNCPSGKPLNNGLYGQNAQIEQTGFTPEQLYLETDSFDVKKEDVELGHDHDHHEHEH
jgi:hypothetical protein